MKTNILGWDRSGRDRNKMLLGNALLYQYSLVRIGWSEINDGLTRIAKRVHLIGIQLIWRKLRWNNGLRLLLIENEIWRRNSLKFSLLILNGYKNWDLGWSWRHLNVGWRALMSLGWRHLNKGRRSLSLGRRHLDKGRNRLVGHQRSGCQNVGGGWSGVEILRFWNERSGSRVKFKFLPKN